MQTGNSKELEKELSMGYRAGSVGDFIAVNADDNLEIEDHLVVTAENPFLSMATRVGNSNSSLFFTGITDLSIYNSDIDDNGTVWYDSITSPLYTFGLVKDDPTDDNRMIKNVKNSTMKNGNETTSSGVYTVRMVSTGNESAFGYVKFDRIFESKLYNPNNL